MRRSSEYSPGEGHGVREEAWSRYGEFASGLVAATACARPGVLELGAPPSVAGVLLALQALGLRFGTLGCHKLHA